MKINKREEVLKILRGEKPLIIPTVAEDLIKFPIEKPGDAFKFQMPPVHLSRVLPQVPGETSITILPVLTSQLRHLV